MSRKKSINIKSIKVTYRVEAHLNMKDYKHLQKVKDFLGVITIVAFVRQSLKIAYVLLTQILERKDVHLLNKKNAKDKTRVPIL